MLRKYLYIILGLLFVGLGFLGAFIPGLPTTIFIIIAAWFFSKSSKNLELWLLNHNLFGHLLTNWKMYGAISKSSKIYAVSIIIPTFILTSFFKFSILGDIIFLTLGSILIYFIMTRPTPPLINEN
jgi:uncharacterized protein